MPVSYTHLSCHGCIHIHAKGLQSSETQYDELLCKYDSIFTYPDENDAEHEVQNYIEELTAIIEDYL